MRGDSRTVSVRSPVLVTSRRWSSWITRSTLRPRRSREERLERLERLSSDRRRRIRSGDYGTDLTMLWRWR